MSVQRRQKRSPISCELCRIRKIRCSRPRGPPPCETCVRRQLASECHYAQPHHISVPIFRNAPPSPVSEQSTPTTAATIRSNEDLAARVANLEALIQAQDANAHSSSVDTILPLGRAKGILLTTETGHVRFIPSATPEDRDNSPYDPHQALCRSVDLSAGPYPLGKSKIEIDQLLDDLPPRHHCSQLKDMFFSSFASLFHILHDPTFSKQYEVFERAPESMSPSWVALLYAIIGTSVMALGPSSGLLNDLSRKELVADKITELSERYRSAAFKCLQADNYLWQQNITTLQALIILIYSINHSHGQTWTLLGMAYHIALSLGCHIDPSEFGLDVIRCEERRRCWASIMMLYMIQAMSLGRLGPDPSTASEGVQMPSDLNDSDLIADEYILPITFNRPSQMSYILLKFRLYEIANEVSSIVRTSLHTPSSLISRVDQRILNEQRSWHDKYLSQSRLAALPTHHKAHLNILQGYSHQLMLLLHNHALRRSVVDSQQRRLSVSRVAHSAEKILHIHTELFTKDEFSPFRWYLGGIGSFHAYHAAVSLIAALAERSWGLTHEDVLPMVKECAERFEALAETSIICNKALPVLRHMLHTMNTWTIRGEDQSQNDSLQIQDQDEHAQHIIFPEPVSESDQSRNECGPDETCDTVYSRNISMLEDFSSQFWLTPLAVLSQ